MTRFIAPWLPVIRSISMRAASFVPLVAASTPFFTASTGKLENLVTVSRSPDWKYGKGFYTAVVIATPENGTSYNVVCKVHVGNANYFEYIELGQTNSIAEALDNWGDIQWTDDSLIIGRDGPNQKVISREQIEKHRCATSCFLPKR